MKVTRGTGVTGAPRASGSKTTARAEGRAAPPRDTISIAGIPQAELTPRVKKAITELIQEVSDLRAELAETRARMEELATLAFTDPLTGVFNRRAFVAELNRTLAIVDRHGQPASLAFFDMNDMKGINDGHGHKAGDAAIIHVARTIRENVRQTDVIGRLGGDEFAVIFNYADTTSAGEKVQSLVDLIVEQPITVDGVSISVGVTAGIAEVKKGASVEATLEIADAAMYQSKKARRSAG